MSAEAPPIDDTTLGASGFGRAAPQRPHDRAFWFGLAVATLLHASVLLGALGAKSKRLGDESGADDAISVSLVTEADFQSRSTVAEEGGGSPAPPAPQTEAAAPAPPPELKQTLPADEPPAPAEPPSDVALAPQKSEVQDVAAPTPETPAPQILTPDTPAPETPAKEAAQADEQAKALDAPELLTLSDPAEGPRSEKEKPKPAEAAPKPKRQKPPSKTAQKPAEKPAEARQKTAKLDLSPPPGYDAPSGAGRSAGFQRPPGITRSGANDDFARGVIRALQQTMPQLRETRGRVTVRILLDKNGNVRSVEVTRPSPDSSLNQSVAFAARQTSYPFPPLGANDADLTFLVTYIYN